MLLLSVRLNFDRAFGEFSFRLSAQAEVRAAQLPRLRRELAEGFRRERQPNGSCRSLVEASHCDPIGLVTWDL